MQKRFPVPRIEVRLEEEQRGCVLGADMCNTMRKNGWSDGQRGSARVLP